MDTTAKIKWRKGFRSWLPVKRKITGCAERLEGISGNCKKNWKFVLKADFPADRDVADTLTFMVV